MKSFHFLPFAFLLLASTVASAEPSLIKLAEIDGRTWLLDPDGQPFFAHGVTHVGGARKQHNAEELGRTFRELGFNAYGYGCPPELRKDLPYCDGRNFAPISMYRTSDGSFRYIDIFNPAVQAELEEAVSKMCFANRRNKNLIGYYWTDLGAWSLKNWTGKNWIEYFQSLPEDASGQQAYQKFLASWDGDAGEKRDRAFLRLIAREYFRVFGEANRKFDPDHLIFGERFTFETAVPEVLEELLPYVDAIAIQPNFQPGFPAEKYDRVHQSTGKPIIICDFAVRFQDGDKKIRGWKPLDSPRAAGEAYADYVRKAMDTPYVLGAFWCNPIDSTPGFSKSGIKQGLFDVGLKPRVELNEVIRELNQEIAAFVPTH